MILVEEFIKTSKLKTYLHNFPIPNYGLLLLQKVFVKPLFYMLKWYVLSQLCLGFALLKYAIAAYFHTLQCHFYFSVLPALSLLAKAADWARRTTVLQRNNTGMKSFIPIMMT